MGKVEILTLIAGVVLSIALALIIVPMFGSSEKMTDKYKIESEMIAVKNIASIVTEKIANEGERYKTMCNEIASSYGKENIMGYNYEVSECYKGINFYSKNFKEDIVISAPDSLGDGTFVFSITYYNVELDFKDLFANDSNLKKICPESDFEDEEYLSDNNIQCKYKMK